MTQMDFIAHYMIVDMASNGATAEEALGNAESACREVLKIDPFNKILAYDEALAKTRQKNDAILKKTP